MDEIQTWWQGHFPSAFISTPCLFLLLGHQDERPHYSRQPSHTPVIISQIAQSQKFVLPLIKIRSCFWELGGWPLEQGSRTTAVSAPASHCVLRERSLIPSTTFTPCLSLTDVMSETCFCLEMFKMSNSPILGNISPWPRGSDILVHTALDAARPVSCSRGAAQYI